MSDSKSPQVSRTFLSILNNAVVWMVSIRPLLSKSSSIFINPLVTVSSAPITIGIFFTFKFRSFFDSLARSRYLFLFSLSFSFNLWSTETAKSTIRQLHFFFFLFSFFFIDYFLIWSSGWDYVIRLYLKVPEELGRRIFQEEFWVVHIPFVCMVTF